MFFRDEESAQCLSAEAWFEWRIVPAINPPAFDRARSQRMAKPVKKCANALPSTLEQIINDDLERNWSHG
jgi:hypothetical protein